MALDFSHYDSRNYDMVSVQEGYGEWSKVYDDRMIDGLDIDLLRTVAVEWQEVRSVADLACGTGRIGAWMTENGARGILGVDICQAMLQHAESKSIYSRILAEDIRDTSIEPGSVDLAVNVLSCGHLTDLDPLYREAMRIVKPGGRFILVGYHPHFMLNGIPTHFRNTDGENVAIETHIHLISDHVTTAFNVGWSLVQMAERVVDGAWVGTRPNWERHLGRPVTFLFDWKK